MHTNTHILALSGSLRAASHNTALLRLAGDRLPARTTVDVYDGLALLPHFNEDHESNPGEAVERLRAAVDGADAVLIATAEYNGSVPGHLKAAVDWLSRPSGDGALKDKPAAVIGSSPGRFGAAWAQGDLRRILGLIGARVLDVNLPIAEVDRRLVAADQELHDAVADVVGQLVSFVRDDRPPIAAAA